MRNRAGMTKGYRIVWPTLRQVEIESYELCQPEAGEVLIETEFSVISAGTEKAWLTAMPNTSNQFPQRPGYSAIGHVVEVGDGVQNLQIGDRVISYFTGHASLTMASAEAVVKVENDAIPSIEAAFTVIAGISLQGVRKARLELGESVLVMGQGILGLFANQLARLSGGLPVITADLSEARRKLALEFGADYAFCPTDHAFANEVRTVTKGKNVNAVIEVTGAAKALTQSLASTAHQGRIVLLGCTRINDSSIDFYQDIHKPGISIIGAHTFVRPTHDSYPGYWTHQDDSRTILDLLSAGRLKVAQMISETVSPDQAPRVYQRLVKSEHAPLGIVFDWTGAKSTFTA